jgi:hypothetical protein
MLKPLPATLTRTPVTDASGRMTKPWLDAIQGTAAASQSTSAAAGYVTLTAAAGGDVAITLGGGSNFVLTLDGSAMTIDAPGGTFSTGDEFSLYLAQDATGNRAVPAFTGGQGGFASDTQARIQAVMAGMPTTVTACHFIYNGTVFLMHFIPTSGIATS